MLVRMEWDWMEPGGCGTPLPPGWPSVSMESLQLCLHPGQMEPYRVLKRGADQGPQSGGLKPLPEAG